MEGWIVVALLVFVWCCCAVSAGERRALGHSRGLTRDVIDADLPPPSVQERIWRWLYANPRIRVYVGPGSRLDWGHLAGSKARKQDHMIIAIYGSATLTSGNGRFQLRQQRDGNLCYRDLEGDRNVWCNGAHERLRQTGGVGDDYVSLFDPQTGRFETGRLLADGFQTVLVMYEGSPSVLPDSWMGLYVGDRGTLQIIELNDRESREVLKLV
jgi:hypothetical protein